MGPRLKINVIIGLLGFAFAIAAARADDRAEAATLHAKLAADFAANPYFHESALNRLRDGVPSPFISRLVAEGTLDAPENNGRPWSARTIAAVRPYHMLKFRAFELAYRGWKRIVHAPGATVRRPEILTVIDFDEPTNSRRLYIFDLARGKVLFNTFTSHGEPSARNGALVPTVFSNVPGSNMTSLGFYETGDEAFSGHDYHYNLDVDGIDGALNSNARRRDVLFHIFHDIDIEYVRDPVQILRRAVSYGCFGIPAIDSGRFYGLADRPLAELVVDAIAGHSVAFAFSSVVDLEKESLWLR